MPISEEELEAGAEGGFEAYRHPSSLPWSEIPRKSKDFWRPIFRAALEAAAKVRETQALSGKETSE